MSRHAQTPTGFIIFGITKITKEHTMEDLQPFSNKQAAIQALFQDMIKQHLNTAYNPELCAFCSSSETKPENFRDERSRKEFKISQLCQNCQDKVFE